LILTILTFYKSHINLDTKSFVRGNRAAPAIALDIDDDEHVQQVLRDMQEDEQPISKSDKYQDILVAYIDSCVKSYELDETSGLGVIMMVEKMRKLDKGSFVLGVFFDIESRETLCVIR
jgi:hypothetical protein